MLCSRGGLLCLPDQLHFVNTVLTARLLTAYGRRQLNKRAEAERIAKEQRIQADRMREENMTDEEWQKELQRREQVKAERRTYGEHLRSATHSAGRSRASMVADIESTDNWMDSL